MNLVSKKTDSDDDDSEMNDLLKKLGTINDNLHTEDTSVEISDLVLSFQEDDGQEDDENMQDGDKKDESAAGPIY